MGPDMSSRQMAWMYASAKEAHGMDLVCSWSNEGCQTQGVEPKPWGAATFQVDSGGPGLYSVVYYSMRRNMRLLSANWSCHDYQLKDSNGQLMPCPYDSGLWVQHSGLFICPPGHYSPTGSFPCMRCPPGHIASEQNSTFCTPCPPKSYTGFTNDAIDDQSNIECLGCPTGKLSLVAGSTYEDCSDCEYLLKTWPERRHEFLGNMLSSYAVASLLLMRVRCVNITILSRQQAAPASQLRSLPHF